MIYVRLLRQKETPNNFRYAEVPKADRPLVVGVLYLRKEAAAQLGNPAELYLTIDTDGKPGQ